MKVTAASTAAAVLLLAASATAELSHSAPARSSRRSLEHHRQLIARQPVHSLRNATDFELDLAHSLQKRGASGSATYYNTQTGNAGSCGQFLNNNEMVVALASPGWGVRNDACGKTIVITIGGQTHTARVMDTCPTGGGNCGGPCDIDMSPGLFSAFSGLGAGKLFGVSWYYADTGKSCDGSSGGGGGGGGGGNNNSNNNDDDDGDNGAAAAAAAAKASSAAAAKSSSAAAAASSASAAASKSSAAAAAKASSAASAKSASKHASYLSAKSASSAAKAQASQAAAEAKQPQNLGRLSEALDGLYQIVGQAHAQQ